MVYNAASFFMSTMNMDTNWHIMSDYISECM